MARARNTDAPAGAETGEPKVENTEEVKDVALPADEGLHLAALEEMRYTNQNLTVELEKSSAENSALRDEIVQLQEAYSVLSHKRRAKHQEAEEGPWGSLFTGAFEEFLIEEGKPTKEDAPRIKALREGLEKAMHALGVLDVQVARSLATAGERPDLRVTRLVAMPGTQLAAGTIISLKTHGSSLYDQYAATLRRNHPNNFEVVYTAPESAD